MSLRFGSGIGQLHLRCPNGKLDLLFMKKGRWRWVSATEGDTEDPTLHCDRHGWSLLLVLLQFPLHSRLARHCLLWIGGATFLSGHMCPHNW
ncbi:hypothetical protein DENSPDRAFT_146015 [Dentipellis sp. KUC8613]|nr:hypothetical protein DENSPDRAFT_146015 [Dentipellis sp. KUC8613]